MNKLIKYAVILFILCMPSIFHSQNSASVNSGSILSQQAKELYGELRCLICQNQSLLESDAPLAIDLKKLIKEKLEEGKTKKEIKNFLVNRYGEFILLRPVLSFQNLVLWIGPIIFLIIGVLFAYTFYSKTKKLSDENKVVNDNERKEAKKLLKEE